MNESTDRELGEIQQKLENTSNNLSAVKGDLTRLFINIEQESKDTLREIARVENKINIHLKTDEKDKERIGENISELENNVKCNEKLINKEYNENAIFETEVKTGIRFSKYMAGIFGAIATIISTATAIFAYLNKG